MHRGLNKYYYSIAISYRKNEFEQKMLANLHKSSWANSLKLADFTD
jgi:26S proteasome regulatory subunit N11